LGVWCIYCVISLGAISLISMLSLAKALVRPVPAELDHRR
jgi:hypothetical protein